jgi:Kef-type K+ transport system membrane component KefB
MNNAEFGPLTFQLFLLLATAHLVGWLFDRMRQPRVIGEILAGVLLGPSILGHFAPAISKAIFSSGIGAAQQSSHQTVLGFLYNLGLLLLMFVSGAETRGIFTQHDRREVAWLGIVGTGLPFVVVMAVHRWIPLDALMGPAGQRVSLLLVVGIAVAVTSIPVISRILYDLGVLHTRFARLVLGVAILEDIVLWAILAVATALAGSGGMSGRGIGMHVLATLAYFWIGLKVAPPVLKRLSLVRWNVLAHTSPVGYLVVILLAYAGLAYLLDVSLVFAAFLAGFGILADAPHLSDAIHILRDFSFAVFIPVYFAGVGLQLDLTKTFSLTILAVFLIAGCALKFCTVGLGARLAGFGWLDAVNLGVATNARGGPGIVLASVAYDAGIINSAFFTTLVLVAILTSQAAGAWLKYVLGKGWDLLSEQRAKPRTVPVGSLIR